jgi:ribosomal-protein-alanine N-acetyltransferase
MPSHIAPYVLLTERLLLRPFRLQDFAAVHAYASLPEVSEHQAWGPNTEDDTRHFLEQSILDTQETERARFHFAVVSPNDTEFFGGCTLFITNPGLREAMIGYTFSPHCWGRGYATETARALLRLGFEELGLHRITSWATPENIASWRVMEKAGMRREGHEREAAFFKEAWHDWVRYALLDHEWQQHNK